jgi:hypothetical protein
LNESLRPRTRRTVARPDAFTIDGSPDGELDQDEVDAFFASVIGTSIDELRADDTD